MKVKPGFNLHEVCGENIIVAEGEENIDFSNIISMNETSAYLWKAMQEKNVFTIDDMVAKICEEYDVEEDKAREDCTMLATQWYKAGIIEGEDVPNKDAVDDAITKEKKTLVETSEEKEPKKKGLFSRLLNK